jgi:Ser/Thr protein kinase RdoA (MazF antagonist)
MSEIDAILSHYAAAGPFVRIEPLGNAGGMSGAQFWRLTTPRGTLVLRRWPMEHPTLERLRFIHAVLDHAARNGVTYLPVPIATRDGRTFVDHGGFLWELAPWLAGDADYERSPSDAKLQTAMMALAEFHLATASFQLDLSTIAKPQAAGAPAITKRLERLRALTGGGIAELSRAIDDATWPEFAALSRQFITALPRAIPPVIAKLEPIAEVSLPLQPCIRDIWHDHVLFSDSRVTGIVDFGGVEIDTPATDVARLIGSLAGDVAGSWTTGILAYSEVRPLSRAESQAIPALDAAGIILAGCNWVRWICLEDRRFESGPQVLERFRKITSRCARMVEPRS